MLQAMPGLSPRMLPWGPVSHGATRHVLRVGYPFPSQVPGNPRAELTDLTVLSPAVWPMLHSSGGRRPPGAPGPSMPLLPTCSKPIQNCPHPATMGLASFPPIQPPTWANARLKSHSPRQTGPWHFRESMPGSNLSASVSINRWSPAGSSSPTQTLVGSSQATSSLLPPSRRKGKRAAR